MLRYITTLLLFFVSFFILSQNIFYQNTLKGKVSLRTFSMYDTSSVNVPLNTGDRINKAFLIATNLITEQSVLSYFNNNEIKWDSTNKASNTFQFSNLNVLNPTANIHVIDVTNYLRLNDSVFTLYTPNENLKDTILNNPNPLYVSFSLYLEYSNTASASVSSTIILNETASAAVINYSLYNLPLINNVFPVALSMSMGYMWTTIGDGSYMYVNNDSIGLVHGDECCGSYTHSIIGQYDYYNNTLYGVGDDTADSLMNGPDLLADIKSYVNYGDTQLNIESRYESPNVPYLDPTSNPIWATFLTYSTNCDTLHSYLTTADTTICAGEVLNLAVGGDSTYTYAWRYRGNVVSTDSILNITPNENRLYSIMVSDTNGCSKTEIINIKVNPKPKVFISTQDALCPNNNGAIVIDSVQGIAAPYRYRKDFGPWQTAPVYGSLFAGEYNISVADTNGCITTKTITINEVNNTVANFSYETPLPFVPTTIDFTNQSQNASEYQWLVNGALVNNSTNLTHFFEGVGDYQLSLVAAKQNEQCTDTLSKTINLERENYIYVPSNWGEESPLALYSLGYVQLEFRLLNGLGQVVHVLSIPITSEEQFLIGNKNLARGIYFYELKATKVTGEKVALGGKVIRL